MTVRTFDMRQAQALIRYTKRHRRWIAHDDLSREIDVQPDQLRPVIDLARRLGSSFDLESFLCKDKTDPRVRSTVSRPGVTYYRYRTPKPRPIQQPLTPGVRPVPVREAPGARC